MSDHNAIKQSRCYAPKAPEQGPPLFQHGDVVFQAHHVGWIVTGLFTTVATVASLWLVNKHLQWYTVKREQRYIVRILFMVPIYSIISLASYLFWDQGTPLLLIRDAYESTVLTSFFYLLLMYLSPNSDEQKAIFLQVGLSRTQARQSRRSKRRNRDISLEGRPELEVATVTDAPKGSLGKVKTKRSKGGPSLVTRWNWPLGWIRWKPKDGVHFLWLMKWGVLQYCVIRPTTTLAAVILEYQGLYCEASWNPKWGHPWVISIISISVTIAMYCLIQLYMPVAWHLAKHRPLLKLFAIKAVVFLTFWQATFLSVLALFGVVKDTRYMTAQEINIGFGALLETFEMMIIAFLHINAFSYKPYCPPPQSQPPPKRTSRWMSLGNVMDFRETWREVVAGVVWIWDWAHGKERRVDRSVWREVHLERALGRSRLGARTGRRYGSIGGTKERTPEASVGHDTDRSPARFNGGYGYRSVALTPYADGLWQERMRGMSEDFEEEVEKELRRKGYELARPHDNLVQGNDVEEHIRNPRQSWWRSVYDHLSRWDDQSHDRHSKIGVSSHSPEGYLRRSPHHPTFPEDSQCFVGGHEEYDYEDVPPVSIIKTYQDNRRKFEDENAHSTATSDGHQQPNTHFPHFARGQPMSKQASVVCSDTYMGRPFPHAASERKKMLDGCQTVFTAQQPCIKARGEQVLSPESDGSSRRSEAHVSRKHQKRGQVNDGPHLGVSADRLIDATELSPGSLHRRESAFVHTPGPLFWNGPIVCSDPQSFPIMSNQPGTAMYLSQQVNERLVPVSSHRRESVQAPAEVRLVARWDGTNSPEANVYKEAVTMRDTGLPATRSEDMPPDLHSCRANPANVSISPSQPRPSSGRISTPHLSRPERKRSRSLVASVPVSAVEPTTSVRSRQPTLLHPNQRVAAALPRLPTDAHRYAIRNSRHNDTDHSRTLVPVDDGTAMRKPPSHSHLQAEPISSLYPSSSPQVDSPRSLNSSNRPRR